MLLKLLFCTLVFVGAQPAQEELVIIQNVERKIKKVRSQLISKYKVKIPKKVKIHLVRSPHQKIKKTWLKPLIKQHILIGGFKNKKETKWKNIRVGYFEYISFTYFRKIYWINPTGKNGYNGLHSGNRVFIPTFKLALDQIENVYIHERVHTFGILSHSEKFKEIELLIRHTCL